MPKHKVEIELDVPEGWELTGEFRKVANGEHHMSANGLHVDCWHPDAESSGLYFIVRKAFALPGWIPSGWWLTKDEDGKIYCYKEKPTLEENFFHWSAEGPYALITAIFDANGIELPKVDWKQSIWQKQ